jgi:hypothetical protein
MTPEQIKKAHVAVSTVEEMDRAIVSLGGSLDQCPEKYGHAARHALGTSRVLRFTSERLGQVLLCALINDLLDRRTALTRAHPEVCFAAPPCPRQTVSPEGM